MVLPAAAAIRIDTSGPLSLRNHRIFHHKNKQAYAIVGSDPDHKVISDVWLGKFDTQREYRCVLEHIFDLFSDGSFRYWLTDLRFMNSDFHDSEDWLVKKFMPAAFEAGLERQAVVLPDPALKKEGAASNALRSLADDRVRSFTDIQLAKQWLLKRELPEA